jgi:hypothetical protein
LTSKVPKFKIALEAAGFAQCGSSSEVPALDKAFHSADVVVAPNNSPKKDIHSKKEIN